MWTCWLEAERGRISSVGRRGYLEMMCSYTRGVLSGADDLDIEPVITEDRALETVQARDPGNRQADMLQAVGQPPASAIYACAIRA